MATTKGSAKGRNTEKVNVWLTPEQAEWLRGKKNISETVRALVTEAINLENLAKSVRGRGPSRSAAPAASRPRGSKKSR